jgi:hypothetical protein
MTSIVFNVFSGYTKILSGLEKAGSFEIINLESSVARCARVPSFNSSVLEAMAALGTNEMPVICGGVNNGVRNECFTLEKVWTGISPLPIPIYGGAMVSMNGKESSQFLLAGGQNFVSHLSSVFVMENNSWQNFAADLPLALQGHCMVRINSTSVMIVGGVDMSSLRSETYFIHSWKAAWVAGPSLQIGRERHSCGRIRKTLQPDSTFGIIATGGYGSKTVEILGKMNGSF